jgi:hypothetical protein
MNSESSSPRPGKPSHYEIDRLSKKAIFGGALGLFVLLGAVLAIVWMLVRDWTREPWPQPGPPAPPAEAGRWNTAAPQLQVDPGMDLAQMRKIEKARLHAVGWTDASHTYATIPIEEAMRLMGEAAAEGRLGALLPPPQPATPLELQNQKSRALAEPVPPATNIVPP